MEHQKNNYTGRFGKAEAPKAGTAARKPQSQDAPRKPSGFSAAAQGAKRAPQPKVQPAKPEDKKSIKQKKQTREKQPRSFSLKKLLAGMLIVVLLGLILIVIFGDRGAYHMMPTITREETEGSFEPETTPLPGA